MRLRAFALVCALAMLGSFVAAGLASAAPRHNHNLTIAATPNPVIAGKAVLIYGRLSGAGNSGQTIGLYHHVVGGRRGYTLVTTTVTDSFGYYDFVRPDGLVNTSRDWFVVGPSGAHSRTIHERAIALVSLNTSTTITDTNHPIVFRGQVTPNHAFEQVFLQQQIGSSDDWRTLRATTLGPGSSYWIAYRWRRPGLHDVRVLFRGDARNVRGASDPASVTVQQAQVPGFTIGSGPPVVDAGGSVTISGILDQSGSTAPDATTLVQLWGKAAGQRHFGVLGDATTGGDGSYSFTQSGLTTNTIYYVATMRLPHVPRRHTALVYQGVRDVVAMRSSTSNTTTGQIVTFSGTVQPDKTGHVVYLQTQGADGDWHTVQVAIVSSGSSFQFSWTAGSPGSQAFRAHITSDRQNVGSSSPPVSVTGSAPPASTLTGAS